MTTDELRAAAPRSGPAGGVRPGRVGQPAAAAATGRATPFSCPAPPLTMGIFERLSNQGSPRGPGSGRRQHVAGLTGKLEKSEKNGAENYDIFLSVAGILWRTLFRPAAAPGLFCSPGRICEESSNFSAAGIHLATKLCRYAAPAPAPFSSPGLSSAPRNLGSLSEERSEYFPDSSLVALPPLAD